MAATLAQAKRYAALKRTKIFDAPGGHFNNEDGSISFVLMSGPKLTMTEQELDHEIKSMEKALAKEQAILALNTEDTPAKTEKPVKAQK